MYAITLYGSNDLSISCTNNETLLTNVTGGSPAPTVLARSIYDANAVDVPDGENMITAGGQKTRILSSRDTMKLVFAGVKFNALKAERSSWQTLRGNKRLFIDFTNYCEVLHTAGNVIEVVIVNWEWVKVGQYFLLNLEIEGKSPNAN
jgi:hypothetical protein